jgi:O-antigen/teichoic acid export membrane protein
VKNLKEKTIRGGFARLCAQAANFILRLGSLMVLARLLTPKDFGLVGMVTAFTGVLTLFRDFGLSSAAIQRPTVTQEQLSTLFWINLLVGAVLAVLSVAFAPFIAIFYHEPRLIGITDVLALGFFFNAAGVQHSALLQREMRFTALAVINTIALIMGTAIAIGGARVGFGYWALVLMTVTMPLVSTLGFWLATAWIPGAPRRRSGIRSMVHFGGTVTLNGLVAYIATNCDKILLGRFWGVDALGMYGRAYQLVNIPTDNLNQAAGEVAFSALSRIQDDPQRLKNYFLKGYSLVLALTVPITIACALFANDITLVLLGPKWIAGGPILRLLAPTILVFAIANPLFWLLSSLGLVKRSLKMSFVIAPVMVGSYLIGLPYGPRGVAFAYSAGMMLWIFPLIAWAVHDTVVSVKDILLAVFRPLASSVVAAVVAFGVHSLCGQLLPPFARLALESTALLVTFALMLLFATGQKSLYLDLLRGLKGSSAAASVSSLEKSEVL